MNSKGQILGSVLHIVWFFFNFSLGRQGSCVTFDPSLGPLSGSGSLPSQRSESLSLTSDGEIPGDIHSYSDGEKLGKQQAF